MTGLDDGNFLLGAMVIWLIGCVAQGASGGKMKVEERERFRRAMAKARTGGPNGQRKLGRESKVLLEKVKKMVENR